ncbi:Hypothetical protein I596_1447 [Dokdonella koreensis DS-123]|uniref:Uncharacterized protein n=1 Tax=Dokdonella koreensis DS-123 TaxID=1300342 RepID=A0A160DT21_9GAMM|nr:Hypothetical protein I596_1447 [Dokdonella koreensis DS-123]
MKERRGRAVNARFLSHFARRTSPGLATRIGRQCCEPRIAAASIR